MRLATGKGELRKCASSRLDESLPRIQHIEDTTPEDARWFMDIVIDVWPNICRYIGQSLKENLARLSALVNIALPHKFFEEIDIFAEHLKENPITFPIETSWVNSIIQDAWDLIQPTLQDAIGRILVPRIQDRLPGPLKGLTIDPCTIGKNPPCVTKLTTEARSKRTSDGPSEYIDITLALDWNSDLDIAIHGKKFKTISLGIEGVSVSTELHVCLIGVTSKPPFIRGVNMWAVNPPAFMLDWKGLLNFLDADVFQSLIQRVVTETVSSKICLPNRIGIPLGHHDIFQTKAPQPEGLLKLTVIGATGLRTDDFHLFSLWNKKRTCDPYVHMQFGDKSFETRAEFGSDGDCEWKQSFHFLIDEFCDQRFHFTVFDFDYAGGDDPLARSLDVSPAYLLGVSNTGPPESTVANHVSLPMEVIWTRKLESEDQARQAEFLHGHHAEEDGEHGFVFGALASTGQALKNARIAIVDQFNKRTGADPEEWKNLESKLLLQATFTPFEVNETVANMVRPDMQSSPFTSQLFVGVYGCHDLAHCDVGLDALVDPVSYFALVSCTPHISLDGESVKEITEESWRETSVRSKNRQSPKANMGMDTADDKEEEITRKIMQLVEHGVPFEAVAEVMDVSVDRVQAIEEDAASRTTEHIDIIWNSAFQFPLADPRKAELKIQVVKRESGLEDQVIGSLSYQIKDILGSENLTVEPQRPLDGCNDKKTRLKVRIQLQTLFLGPQYPPRVNKPSADTDLLAAKLAKKKSKQRYIYLDRMGNQRTQVNGMWVQTRRPTRSDRPPSLSDWAHREVAMVENAVASGAHVVAEGAHMVSEGMHRLGDKMKHLFHRDHAGEQQAPLAGGASGSKR